MLYRRLRIIRFRFHKTRSEMDELLDLDRNTWGLIESGKKNTPMAILTKLVQEYGVSPLYLITGEGQLFTHPDSGSFIL